MSNINLSQVACSLSLGTVMNKTAKSFCYFSVVSSAILATVPLFVFVTPIEANTTIVTSVILCSILGTAIFAFMLYLLLKNRHKVKKFTLWLENGITLDATCRCIGENIQYDIVSVRNIKIEVKFKLDNKIIKKESTAKIDGVKKGYMSIFSRYENKKITIVYSPKYDEVLIVKLNDDSTSPITCD